MGNKVIVYGHATCPMVPPVLGLLKQSKVNYEYQDIHKLTDAREHVREINNGMESVPTLVFPDGSTLTEPSTGQLKTKLESFGYHVPLLAQLMGNAHLIVIGLIVLYALLSFLEVI